jgi:cytochrome bd-type quinol oxidase subunit 2
MGRVIALVTSVLLIAVGLLWTFQGLGYIKGSGMSGAHFWAVVGPAVAGFGVALAIVALRRKQGGRR